MKKIILSILVSTSLSLNAQNVGINGDGTAPDSSAMLDVKAPDKGMLIPRVKLDDATTAAPVTNPKEGLLVYNETGAEAKGFWYWNGTEWVRLGSSEKGGLQSIQTFTSSGTWTRPAGITHIKVTVTGGGGGGGSHNNDDAQGGGGAGGTAIKIIDVSAINSMVVTVGAGGNGGCGNGNTTGTNGTESSFGVLVRGTGGARPMGWAIGGLGGDGIGGDINIAGGDGFGGNIDGAANGETGGNGGASYWGSGGAGGSVWVSRSNSRVYGSGGAGTHANSNSCGSDGMSGIVIIEEYSSASGSSSVTPQTLSIAGNNLSITNGNTVAIPQQTLSISGNDLSILNGNTITLPIPNAADSTRLTDADNDTKVQVEESVDEDIIRFDLAGIEKWVMTGNRLEPQNTLNGVFIGIGAGQANTASWNTGVGTHALTNSTGQHNTAIGADVLKTNTTGQLNTAIGVNSMILANGSKNTAVGHSTLANVTGNGNIGIGYTSGSNIITGNNNIAIGYDSEVPSQTADNQLSIGNLIYGTGLDGTGGTVSSGNIGIGEKVPTEKLHITNGSLKIDDGANPYTLPSADGTANQIMQTDGSGNVSWVNNSASSTVEAWKTPTFVNSWVNYESVNPGNNYSTAGYYIDRERVYLKGLLGNGAINSACFILPVGYRPNTRVLLSTISGSSTGRVDILPTGEVVIYSPSNSIWVSLEGLSFRINQ